MASLHSHEGDPSSPVARTPAPESVPIPALRATVAIPSRPPSASPPYRRRRWPRLPLARWLTAGLLAALAWLAWREGVWDRAIAEAAALLRDLERR